MKVAVCIITFRRRDGLKRLLDGVNQQIFNVNAPPDIEVIVVNNDVDDPLVSQLCQEMRPYFHYPLMDDVQPQRGIPFARNKSVACVGADVDFIVFIDDDEVPEPNWLDELLTAQRLYNADAVTGPVIPYFDQPVADWVIQGKFFERPRYTTGEVLRGAATNNILVRADILRKMDEVFAERFALNGGDDWHLFQRVYRSGYKIVWTDTALVHEWIPASRTTVRWLLQRSYRLGNTESLCEIDLEPSFKTRVICSIKGVRRVILGAMLLPWSFLRGKHWFIRKLRYILHSFGMLSGVSGKIYYEYQTVHKV